MYLFFSELNHEQGKKVCVFYLFASDVLEVLACHDASEFGFNKALGPLPLWRPAKDDAHKHFTTYSVTAIQVFQQWKVQQWLVPASA